VPIGATLGWVSDRKRPQSGTEPHGDTVRERHVRHFDDCEATGQHSSIYLDYLFRDLEPHLLAVLRELEQRASMVLAGEPRRRVLSLLYDRQDNEPEQLVSYFIQCTDAESPLKLGFGHLGGGRMGIVDNALWQRHVDEFRESIWASIVQQSRQGRG
jgi:hypothetical protein